MAKGEKANLETIARQTGEQITPGMISHLVSEMDRVGNMRRSDNGKYKVLGIDKFDYSDWVQGEFDTAEEALKEARTLTKKAMRSASGEDIATVFYAYSPEGKYLGGNTWQGE